METLSNINLKNKRVLVRIDFNGAWRIKAHAQTLNYILNCNPKKIIVIGHFGRPKGKVDKNLSLEQFKNQLPQSNKIILKENLRFDKRETKPDLSLAKELASQADIFVQDAFSVCHRKHASVIGLPQLMPSCAGLVLQREIKELSAKFAQPLMFVIGGAKIKTKLLQVKKLVLKQNVSKILLGGKIANRVLQTLGDYNQNKLILPIDGVTKKGTYLISELPQNEKIFDLGMRSIKEFKKILVQAKTIVWNGPLGKFEQKPFNQATKEIGQFIANSPNYTIIGGGETIKASKQLKLLHKFSFVSTGGGAMLEFLACKTLPGIEALKKTI